MYSILRKSLGQYALSAFAFLLIASCGVSVRAQVGGIDTDPGDPGTGGKNTIQGRIYVRGGTRLPSRAKVKLRNMNSGEQFTFSDDTGAFSFRRLIGGTYTLTVDAGEPFEIATERVDIIEPMRRRNDPGIVVPVTIYIEAKGSGTRSTIGTVDAASGGVPDKARQLYKEALELGQAGDRAKAIDKLKQALQVYPNFMTAFNELGVQYLALKKYKEAAEALREAIKLAPDAFHPRLNYGIVLLQLKEYKAALAELQSAAQKDSSSAVAHFQLGRALVNVGNYNAAERSLKQSLSIGGEDVVEAHRYLAVVYIETQKSQLAADELEYYLKLAPKTKDADKIRTMIKELRSQASGKTR
jgi:tetratricopeptide (TPR) repeat protein